LESSVYPQKILQKWNIYIIYLLERPLSFDPFGQTVFAHFGHKMIDPCKVLVQGPKLGALSSL